MMSGEQGGIDSSGHRVIQPLFEEGAFFAEVWFDSRGQGIE